MEENSNYYRLKSPRSARVEGHTGKVSGILIFSVVFTAAFIFFSIYTIIKSSIPIWAIFFNTGLFTFIIAVFLGFGIHAQIKYNKNNAAERKLLKDCLCADGIITQCKSVEYETHHGDRTSHSYKVTVEYTFTDDKNELRRGAFAGDYGYDPEFYDGQHLMIAFNDTVSAILCEFSFIKEDEERFLQNEAARSDDDFDGLNGRPVDVDTGKKIQSAELEHVWFWAAFALFIFVAAYTIPISILAVPQIISGIVVLDVFIIIILYLVPALLTAVIVYFITKYIKLRRRFEKILNNEPNFVWGKIFASENTYRRNVRKTVFYCYVDEDGNRFTKSFWGPTVRKAVQGKPVDVAIMYDKDGNSIPLYSYKFIDEE